MTWTLVSQSFGLLRREPKLMVFPIFSALGAVALSLPFLPALFGIATVKPHGWGVYEWLLLFLWYFGFSFVTIFFNCALAACTQMSFAGQEPTIGEGLRRAMSRIHVIFLWALLTSVVGRIIGMLEERAGFVGKIGFWLLGMSWNVSTFLIVPVLVMEDRGVIESLRRSVSLLKKTWGEQLISNIAFGWILLALCIPGVVLGVIASNDAPILWIPTIAYFAVLFTAFSAAQEIFTMALYQYATTGEPPAGYDGDHLRSALRR